MTVGLRCFGKAVIVIALWGVSNKHCLLTLYFEFVEQTEALVGISDQR